MNMPPPSAAPSVQRDALHFLPLGGAGEIGMNLNLYACQGTWLMVDLGITFAGDTLPGIDVIMPDPAFIEERREDLLAIVLTHAHEDHLGAVAYLWPRLRCPVYATPFAAAILREKLLDAKLLSEVPLNEVALSSRLELGPFALTFISLTHSIPEPNALLIETPYGRVMHTGDWKIDPDPLVGDPLDEAALRQAGEAGVLALVGDSTNATVEGESGSEGEVRETLARLVAERENGLAVTLFASNVARLESVALAARDAGREPVLVGRSLHRYVRAARACGYLEDRPAAHRGRGRAASQQPGALSLHRLPGRAARRDVQDRQRQSSARKPFRRRHGDLLVEDHSRERADHRRPSQQTAAARHRGHHGEGRGRPRLRPSVPGRAAPDVPVDPAADRGAGAWRGTSHAGPRRAGPRAPGAGAGLRRERRPVAARAGPAAVIGRAPSGRLALDGENIVATDHVSIGARRKLMHNGAIFVSVVVDRSGRTLVSPLVSGRGVLDADDQQAAREAIAADVADAVDSLTRAQARDERAIEEAARRAIRRALRGAQRQAPGDRCADRARAGMSGEAMRGAGP